MISLSGLGLGDKGHKKVIKSFNKVACLHLKHMLIRQEVKTQTYMNYELFLVNAEQILQ